MTDSTSRYATKIRNENGKLVRIEVKRDLDTDQVTIYGRGPESTCEHTWTLEEAKTIFKGLGVVLNRHILDE